MTYSIEFYNAAVLAEVEGWPAGINASFSRIAEQMVESGPNLGLPYTRPFGDGLFEMRAKCVFHVHLDTDSTRTWTVIP